MKKRILVAPLNWGLGHATRCIPIIKALLHYDFEPIIASDGNALALLKVEFPQLHSIELPNYHITYAKKGRYLKLKLLKDSPRMLKAINKERQQIKDLVKSSAIDGIISDNRFGVYSKEVPSVFITHQLKVLSGTTTWLSTKMHAKIMSKYNECWVPDTMGSPNLSGDLGHIKTIKASLKYIGPISRFEKQTLEKKFDLLVLLSGPEPQRSILETLLFKELKRYKGTVLFVKGCVETNQEISTNESITIYNYMTSAQLQQALNESEYVVSRSGYTTIMDLAKIEKKAFFIPTPGQFEQEYLAKRLEDEGVMPSCSQEDFSIEMLNAINLYKGFKGFNYNTNVQELFSLFKGE
jgi:uncharacterized protein (TIGR00661 family)